MMDKTCTPPPRPDGDFDISQNGMLSVDTDMITVTHHTDQISGVSDKKTTCAQLDLDLKLDLNLDLQKTSQEENQASQTPPCSFQIPKIVIQTPDGSLISGEKLDLELFNLKNVHTATPSKKEAVDFGNSEAADDSDCQSKNSSHYLTPPSSRDSTTAVRSSLNLIVNPDSDSSVTNDEDIQVICRCASTPVNSCIGKNLNETDCSMSTVDDASPISPAELSKANVSSNRCATASEDLEKPKVLTKDPVEQDVMYLQQSVTERPNLDINQQDNQDTKSSYALYNVRDQDYPMPYQHDYSNHSLGMYQGLPNEYPNYMHSQSGYIEYYPNGQRSWTDVRGRFDRPYVSYPIQNDPCCYPSNDSGGGERVCFVYPSIYVSSAGLISVLLRNDMSVEMTVDRTIRVVSHNHMMAVATDSKGTSACLYHPAVKVFQMGYATDISTDSFRARMDNGDAILFSNGVNYFRLQDSELQPVAPVKFSDINRDQSVNLLFSSEGYGESLVATCMQVAAQAEYANLPKGGVIVRINGVKVTQSGCGDVTVVTGAKFIRLSPHNGTTRLGNRFLDIEVEKDWSVKLTRGSHSFVSTKKQVTVCNGKMEAGFDENSVLKVINLQARYPLLSEPSIVRRPGRKIVRSVQSTQSACSTPRRRFPIQGASRGGTSSC